MAARVEMLGKTFGQLVVIAESEKRTSASGAHWDCLCSCGKTAIVWGSNLRRGITRSCGCLWLSTVPMSKYRHGKSHTRIHNIWVSMRQRCGNKNDAAYSAYGARGIKVCDRWQTFENFLEDMGEPKRGQTLDRIDNDLGYYKENCRWATKTQQANNRRSSKMLEFDGRCQTQREWEKEMGLREGQIYERLRRGWSISDALTRPRH